ncbi:MAG: UDP-N-acetylmuramate dehydrogenase, partial [Candidatus Bathyarchaeota archaeon]|nr:UDP-N-acetylmuramate dehydrogenase [Candidatus Bathyarchaeota archaeon]
MIKIQKNISLKDYSTFQIGGLAKYFVLVKNIPQLIEALRWTKEKNLHFSIVGSGSNILFLDNGYQGLIIKIKPSNTIVQDSRIICGAGTMMNKVLSVAAAKKLIGFEWAAGIPGTIGGGIFGNAGAFGWEMKSIIKNVKAINSQNFQIENFDNEQCEFSYRSSVFKKQQRHVIVEAELKLKKGDQEEIRKNIKSNLLYRK